MAIIVAKLFVNMVESCVTVSQYVSVSSDLKVCNSITKYKICTELAFIFASGSTFVDKAVIVCQNLETLKEVGGHHTKNAENNRQ